jgi:hypothetical protein
LYFFIIIIRVILSFSKATTFCLKCRLYTHISNAKLLVIFTLDAKPSFLYFSKYNIISFTSLIVTLMHADLNFNFLQYIIVNINNNS